MRKFLMVVFSFLMVLGFSGMAGAIPIDYQIGGESSVTLDGNVATTSAWGWEIGGASISGTLLPGLGNGDGQILDGQTHTIDFFTLTVNSWGVGGGDTYDISAVLDLDIPDVDASGTGGGLFGSLAGFIQGGTLFWDQTTLPDVYVLQDGSALSINFESGIELGLGNTATVHAYLTNQGTAPAPVPEPATMLLLGTGLVGLAGASRKKIFKKK